MTKPNMTVARQGSLSPFGLLTQLFTEELTRRSAQTIGSYRPMHLAYLEEDAEEAQPAAPELHFDLNVNLLVNRLKSELERDKNDKPERQKTPEQRILERVILRERERSTAYPQERRLVIESGGKRVTASLPMQTPAQKTRPIRTTETVRTLEPEARQAGEERSAQPKELPRRSAALTQPLRTAAVRGQTAARTLTLASQAMSVPAAGGWTPTQREAHPGYPSQEAKAKETGTPAGSILLPDVMRRRREAALARSEQAGGDAGMPETLEALDEALAWGVEGAEQTPESERVLRRVRRAVLETLRRNEDRAALRSAVPENSAAPEAAPAQTARFPFAGTEQRAAAAENPAEARSPAVSPARSAAELVFRAAAAEGAEPAPRSEARVPQRDAETEAAAVKTIEKNEVFTAQQRVSQPIIPTDAASPAQTVSIDGAAPETRTETALPAAPDARRGAAAELAYREQEEAAEPQSAQQAETARRRPAEPEQPVPAAATRAAADPVAQTRGQSAAEPFSPRSETKKEASSAQTADLSPARTAPAAVRTTAQPAGVPEANVLKTTTPEAAAPRANAPDERAGRRDPQTAAPSEGRPALAVPAAAEAQPGPATELAYREETELAAPIAAAQPAPPVQQQSKQHQPTAAEQPPRAPAETGETVLQMGIQSQLTPPATQPGLQAEPERPRTAQASETAERRRSQSAAPTQDPAQAVPAAGDTVSRKATETEEASSAEGPAQAVPAAEETPPAPTAELTYREAAETPEASPAQGPAASPQQRSEAGRPAAAEQPPRAAVDTTPAAAPQGGLQPIPIQTAPGTEAGRSPERPASPAGSRTAQPGPETPARTAAAAPEAPEPRTAAVIVEVPQALADAPASLMTAVPVPAEPAAGAPAELRHRTDAQDAAARQALSHGAPLPMPEARLQAQQPATAGAREHSTARKDAISHSPSPETAPGELPGPQPLSQQAQTTQAAREAKDRFRTPEAPIQSAGTAAEVPELAATPAAAAPREDSPTPASPMTAIPMPQEAAGTPAELSYREAAETAAPRNPEQTPAVPAGREPSQQSETPAAAMESQTAARPDFRGAAFAAAAPETAAKAAADGQAAKPAPGSIETAIPAAQETASGAPAELIFREEADAPAQPATPATPARHPEERSSSPATQQRTARGAQPSRQHDRRAASAAEPSKAPVTGPETARAAETGRVSAAGPGAAAAAGPGKAAAPEPGGALPAESGRTPAATPETHSAAEAYGIPAAESAAAQPAELTLRTPPSEAPEASPTEPTAREPKPETALPAPAQAQPSPMTELAFRTAAEAEAAAQATNPRGDTGQMLRFPQPHSIPQSVTHPPVGQTPRDIRMTAQPPARRDERSAQSAGRRAGNARSGDRTGEAAQPSRTAVALPVEELAQAAPTELFFAPQAAARSPEEAPARPTERAPKEAQAQSLPAWAQELLEQAGGTDQTQQLAAFQGRADAHSGYRQVNWTMPGAMDPTKSRSVSDPMDLSFKERGEAQESPYGKKNSEAELQRTAEKVYRIIEERLRRELRRSGR